MPYYSNDSNSQWKGDDDGHYPSTPARRSPKKRVSLFSPSRKEKIGDAGTSKEDISPGGTLRRVSSLTPFGGKRNEDGEDCSPRPSSPSKKLGIFSKKDEGIDDTENDINLLVSPKMEQEILKKDRKMFSPIKSMNKLRLSFAKSLNGNNGNIGKDDDNDDDGSSSGGDDNSSGGSEDSDKKLTNEQVMLLLCREFQLMDDDE